MDIKAILNEKYDINSYDVNSYPYKIGTLIKNMSSEAEQQIFLAFTALELKTYNKKFVVDLNDIWEWLYYKNIDDCKLLLNKFKKNKDYIIEGEKILLTVESFKVLCMSSETKKSGEIMTYYSVLEDVIFQNSDTFDPSTQKRFNHIKKEFYEKYY